MSGLDPRPRSWIVCLALLGLVGLCPRAPLHADGTETLGPTPIAAGTQLIGEGIGLHDPGAITLEVPPGAAIQQVLLYWNGFHHAPAGDDTLTLDNGIDPPVAVTGTLIGGPRVFFNVQLNGIWTPVRSSTYRADITALDVVKPGMNVVSIEDLDFGPNVEEIANGASLVVVIDDGGPLATLQLVDGQDLAFVNFAGPLRTTVPQTFAFAPTTMDRTAHLTIIAGSVAGRTSTMGPDRPNIIRVTSGGVTTDYSDLLYSSDGEEWDHLLLDVTVPAGAGDLTVQALSEFDDTSNLPASLAWLVAALDVPGMGSIGDFVYCDDNNNGTHEPNEMPEAGVVVDLRCAGPDGVMHTADDMVRVTATDATGHYLFDDVPPGLCMVQLDETSLPPSKSVGRCAPLVMVDLAPGEAYLDADFCVVVCGPCQGKVSELTLRYLGAADAQVVVTAKKGGVLFDAVVAPGGEFTLVGADDKGTLGTEIVLVVNGVSTPVHTSCSTPIGPGQVYGEFEIVSGASLAGGPLCPLSPPGLCDGNKLCGLTLRYTGESCAASSHDQDPKKATCAGDPAGLPSVRIRASDKLDPTDKKAKVLFDGLVGLGETFEIRSTDSKKPRLPSNVVLHVLTPAGNMLQVVTLHASCSQPLALGDQFGSVVIDDFTTETECRTQPGASTLCEEGKPCGLTLRYTGEDCAASLNLQGSKAPCAGDPAGASPVRIRVSDKDKLGDKKAKVYFDGLVAVGDLFEISALAAGEDKLKSATWVHILAANDTLLQLIGVHTSCSAPLALGDQYGSLVLEGFTTEEICKSSTAPGSDDGLCELGKPRALNLEYTGGSCAASQHAQTDGKFACSGALAGQPLVWIRASDSASPGSGAVFFEGLVALGEVFEIDASAAGLTRLKANTYLHVFAAQGGALLQSVQFHTSCSAPIALDDQYGAVRLVGYTPAP